MRPKEKTVKLSFVDSRDLTYCITTESDIDDLTESINNVGLMNPPFLIENRDIFTIVCGFRRVESCRRLGWSHIRARILDSDTKRLECAKLAITDNAFQRPLNLIEKSRSINILSGLFKDASSLAKELSTVGLPENQSIINKIKNLSHLSNPIQNGILSNTISLSMAMELGRLTQGVGEDFVKLFGLLKLSLNKQREMITLINEIAHRDNISIQKVLQSLQKTLNDENLDRKQKTNKIRVYLKQHRFPAITRAERAFEKHVNELKLGKGSKLIPPKNFEGGNYSLSLYFNSLDELKEHKATLDKIVHNSGIAAILAGR
jgi:ParB family chromosome partitioning protein